MPRFNLVTLAAYDDAAIFGEMSRVAELLPQGPISIESFDRVSKVHSSTLRRRFGSWPKALAAAGLADRVDRRIIRRSREEIITALQEVASRLSVSELTMVQFEANGPFSDGPVRREFGSWRAALVAAGLDSNPVGRRYSEQECFENLLTVWVYYGRQPKIGELKTPPSTIGPKPYVGRWGSWRAALHAFAAMANEDSVAPPLPASEVMADLQPERLSAQTVTLSLRYRVLRRDRFRCVMCGAAPATTEGVELHVDHIFPRSRGGASIETNLRTLCSRCNLGKGVHLDHDV
jgi:hypothetical protein